MGRSRYTSTPIVDNHHYGTWRDPSGQSAYSPDILEGIVTVDHSLALGERLEVLAFRYYGDSELWWIIALANRIKDPFRISPGTLLKIPLDAKPILDKVRR